jgi:hypothetical protein
MLNFLREGRYQQGCRDRIAGFLPHTQDSVYLKGYLVSRPGGLDAIVQYFPSLDEYLRWRAKSQI